MNQNHIFTIRGADIHTISDFYKEINRVFLPNEDWQLGESLDALDDMLYGGYGELKEASQALVIWENSEHCRQTLGVATTLQWHQEKLKNPKFNSEMAKEAIKNL